VNNEIQFQIAFDALDEKSMTSYIHQIANMPLEQKVNAINKMREALHEISPFKTEPVDFVKWVKNPLVHANDYNPNSVAPPEMALLHRSIQADGYTQPIVSVSDPDGKYEVIDGFHRHRVGKECEDIQSRVYGYLPLVQIRESQTDRNDRMAATIRHNRARGEHRVDSMADIVVELKRRFWSDEKIAKELGMEPDEILRLTQVTGLAGLFADREFSEAWEADTLREVEGDEQLDAS
jgi:ParB-like chromosome segregation protein Spo0J